MRLFILLVACALTLAAADGSSVTITHKGYSVMEYADRPERKEISVPFDICNNRSTDIEVEMQGEDVVLMVFKPTAHGYEQVGSGGSTGTKKGVIKAGATMTGYLPMYARTTVKEGWSKALQPDGFIVGVMYAEPARSGSVLVLSKACSASLKDALKVLDMK